MKEPGFLGKVNVALRDDARLMVEGYLKNTKEATITLPAATAETKAPAPAKAPRRKSSE